MSNWKKIGTLPVDAGCIMLVDPCYILPDSRGVEDQSQLDIPYDYKTFLSEMEEQDWPKEFKIKPQNYTAPLGLIIESGYGDGEYPVYAKYNHDGRLVKVMIDFDEEE